MFEEENRTTIDSAGGPHGSQPSAAHSLAADEQLALGLDWWLDTDIAFISLCPLPGQVRQHADSSRNFQGTTENFVDVFLNIDLSKYGLANVGQSQSRSRLYRYAAIGTVQPLDGEHLIQSVDGGGLGLVRQHEVRRHRVAGQGLARNIGLERDVQEVVESLPVTSKPFSED